MQKATVIVFLFACSVICSLGMTGCAHDGEPKRVVYWEPDYGDDLVEISIELIATKDGTVLVAGGEGVAVIRFTNLTEESVCLPLLRYYGKGGQSGLNPSYMSDEFYAGFELADVEYGFTDAKGNVTLKENIAGLPSEIELTPKEFKELAVIIKAPNKTGIYSLRLSFDNRNLEKAIYSHNVIGSNCKPNLFNNDVIIDGVSVIK